MTSRTDCTLKCTSLNTCTELGQEKGQGGDRTVKEKRRRGGERTGMKQKSVRPVYKTIAPKKK